MAGAPEGKVAAVAFRCDSCGAPWELRGFQTTRTIACESCGSIFDTRGEQWQLVQQVERAYKTKPRFALGTRGQLDGVEWEVIGWQERSVTAWGQRYPWEEHLLFNPYEGFRYLMVQDGHCVVVEPVAGVPDTGVNRAAYKGRTYKHFSTADAVVDAVLGEFPWEVRRGDAVSAADYVDPPSILSSEAAEGEVTWSQGRYLPREEVIAAFGRPATPLGPIKGIHPCQPNPHRATARWMAGALAVALAAWVLFAGFYLFSRQNKVVWEGKVPPEGVLVEGLTLDSFTEGAPLSVHGAAPLRNQWVYLSGMLVNPVTEQAYFLGLELSYYSGSDWSEGSRSGSEVVSGVPNGTYHLQLTPDPKSLYKGPVEVEVRRDVPLFRYVCCSFFLLLVVPALVFVQSYGFEVSRWKESDHPMS